MARPGRKPLALQHVEHLEGSEHAKQRMTTLLMTLEGSCTIDEARSRLNVSESRLHDLRQHWLQGALELLEPRRPGRPPRGGGSYRVENRVSLFDKCDEAWERRQTPFPSAPAAGMSAQLRGLG